MTSAIRSIRGGFDRNNVLHVQWHIGNYCNYRCTYCKDPLRDGSNPFVEIDIAKRVVDNITSQLEGTNRRAEFTLSGGEPTVYKELEELLQYMYDKGAYSHIITNGSRSLAYYKRIAPLLTHGAIFTYHSEYAKLDKFTEIVRLFDPRQIMVYIPMNIATWDICVQAYETLTAQGIRAIPKTVFEDFGNGGINKVIMYNKEQRDFIHAAAVKLVNKQIEPATDREIIQALNLEPKAPRKNSLNHRTIEIIKIDGTVEYTTPQNLIINKKNDFRGMKCNAGIDFLLIGYDGSVFRANCQRAVIANIKQTPEFPLPTIPITCNIPLCWCEGDILINKNA